MSDAFNNKIVTKFKQRAALDRVSYTGNHPNSYRSLIIKAGRLLCSKCGKVLEDSPLDKNGKRKKTITSRSNKKLTRYFHRGTCDKLVEY